MKCEIIRDLLPSYVDGLTSEESNREITAHVAECAPCKEILEQMQEEVQEKAPKEKRKINPFRKFNRRMRRAVAMAALDTRRLRGALPSTPTRLRWNRHWMEICFI